jgi:hypothetical protein
MKRSVKQNERGGDQKRVSSVKRVECPVISANKNKANMLENHFANETVHKSLLSVFNTRTRLMVCAF